MNEHVAGSGALRVTAMILIAVGALTVMIMRGCSSLQKRGAAADYSKYQQVQAEFRDKWQDKRNDLEKKSRDLTETMNERREADRKAGKNFREIEDSLKVLREEQDKVNKQLRDIRNDEQKERDDLQAGDWKKLKQNSRRSVYAVAGWGYIRQWILIPSVCVFFLGLLLLAKAGTKTESMIALVMIGVVIYSLFVGGELWADSPLDSSWMFMRGM